MTQRDGKLVIGWTDIAKVLAAVFVATSTSVLGALGITWRDVAVVKKSIEAIEQRIQRVETQLDKSTRCDP